MIWFEPFIVTKIWKWFKICQKSSMFIKLGQRLHLHDRNMNFGKFRFSSKNLNFGKFWPRIPYQDTQYWSGDKYKFMSIISCLYWLVFLKCSNFHDTQIFTETAIFDALFIWNSFLSYTWPITNPSQIIYFDILLAKNHNRNLDHAVNCFFIEKEQKSFVNETSNFTSEYFVTWK